MRENITEIFENYFENLKKSLKISRIIAENVENYFIKFRKILSNTSDILDKYFSENTFENISSNILKISGNFLENFEINFEKY